MANLKDIIEYCDKRLQTSQIGDFAGAHNGLQVQNNGQVNKIGAAVDAGLIPFQKAAQLGIEFLIVHHGMFWNPPIPLVDSAFDKVKCLLDNNIAVYGAHLPLDLHPEIGNNAILAKRLGLLLMDWVFPFEGRAIAALTKVNESRDQLLARLKQEFPHSLQPILYGSERPKRAIVLTGSGTSILKELHSVGADTIITGELKQDNFNLAQELKLNIFACGHYASEVYGVKALAEELANNLKLPWEFVATECPL